MFLGENLGTGWEGCGRTERGSSRTPLLPRPCTEDTYLQPVRPCRTTVTFEARLSLESVVGKDEETLLCFPFLPLLGAGPPTPDLRAVGPGADTVGADSVNEQGG